MRTMADYGRRLIVVELQAHAVMDLVILERDVVLVHRVPLLDAQLLRARAGLRGEQLLEVANGVVLVALDADLLAQPVVADDLDHVQMRAWASRPASQLQAPSFFSRLVSACCSSQVKSSQSSQVKSSQVKSSQVKSSHQSSVKSSQVKSSQDKSSQVDLTSLFNTTRIPDLQARGPLSLWTEVWPTQTAIDLT